jgi:hypothetical protein
MVFESFKEGDQYRQREMFAEIGFQEDATTSRGILEVPKGEHSAVMLRLNLEDSEYEDVYDPVSPVVYYIGEGRPTEGHQTYSRGNKILAASGDRDLHLFVHTDREEKGYWVYRGIWKLRGYEDSYVSRTQTSDEELQRVFRFWLTKKDADICGRHEIARMIASLGGFLGKDVYVRGLDEESRKRFVPETAKSIDIPSQYRGFECIENTDVIWFAEIPPICFFSFVQDGKAFDSLEHLYRLRHLDARFHVVGKEEHRPYFERQVKTDPFSSIEDRFQYISCDEIVRLHELTLESYRMRSRTLACR